MSSKLKPNGNTLLDIALALDEMFPLKNPSPFETLSAVQRRAGTRDVVEYVQRLQEEEDDLNILNRSMS